MQDQFLEYDMSGGFDNLWSHFVAPRHPSELHAASSMRAAAGGGDMGVPVALLSSCGSSSDTRATYARLQAYLLEKQVRLNGFACTKVLHAQCYA